MEELINQAFIHVEIIGPHVQEGHYDLISPQGVIVLPATWEHFVRPGWVVEMKMWPMDARPGPRPPLKSFHAMRGHSKIPPPPNWNRAHSKPMMMPAPYPNPHLPPPGWNGPSSQTTKPINVGSTKRQYRARFRLPIEPRPVEGTEHRHVAPPNQAMVTRRGPRRSILANEMIPNQSVSRNAADHSLNLRSKKNHAKSEPSDLSSTTSSLTSSFKSSSASSGESLSSITSTREEIARQLISEKGLIVTCTVSSRPLRRPTTILNAAKTACTPPDVLEMSAARIYRDGFEKITFTTLELVKQRAELAPPSNDKIQAGASAMTWK